jgi:CHAT domain-containing protein
MLAFVIAGDDIRIVRLGKRADIATAAAQLYESVRNPESAAEDVRRDAERLAALALWPVAQLVSHRRVIFVPDDALHTVPFAVLPWTPGKEAPMTVEQVELAVVPSMLLLTRAVADARPSRAIPRFELIGDPVFRTPDWRRECRAVSASSGSGHLRDAATQLANTLPRLPGSRDEVSGIVDLARRYAPGSEVREHLGCEATPQALRAAAAANPTLLHIATHGYVDAYRPRMSALVLTPDASSSGATATFGLLEILQMKIGSRLVVLSACDTSRGRLLPGEGVLGPAQAFLQAGAASVVASYWRIADEATARFMSTFYRYLLVDHLPAGAALRRAQIDHARQGGPHVWAAFTLFGQLDTHLN